MSSQEPQYFALVHVEEKSWIYTLVRQAPRDYPRKILEKTFGLLVNLPLAEKTIWFRLQ